MFPGWQDVPFQQPQQTPVRHPAETPELSRQKVPSTAFAESTQGQVPELNESAPVLHGWPGLLPQALPLAHATHVAFQQYPPLQATLLRSMLPSTHAHVPLAALYCETPSTQGFGFVEQAAPSTHATHVPAPLQKPPEHAVPEP